MRKNIKNILCTTDFSRFSNLAISYALSMAEEFDAKLYVCHVIDLTTAGMYGEAFLAFDEQESRITSRALKELKEMRLHKNIKKTFSRNREMVLKLNVMGFGELKKYILTYCNEIEVISPKTFRDQMKAILKSASDLYK